MVFYNLFIFLNNEETVQGIRWLVLQLMADEQLEVSYGITTQRVFSVSVVRRNYEWDAKILIYRS